MQGRDQLRPPGLYKGKMVWNLLSWGAGRQRVKRPSVGNKEKWAFVIGLERKQGTLGGKILVNLSGQNSLDV